MPSLSAEAVDLYTRLLRDEKALAQEIEEHLETRLRAGGATDVCSFPAGASAFSLPQMSSMMRSAAFSAAAAGK